jgi:hypothetical protein
LSGLPDLERKIIENLPGQNKYYHLLNAEEEYCKTVQDHGFRRRIEANNSHSPLPKKSQLNQLSNTDNFEANYLKYVMKDEDAIPPGGLLIHEKRQKSKIYFTFIGKIIKRKDTHDSYDKNNINEYANISSISFVWRFSQRVYKE